MSTSRCWSGVKGRHERIIGISKLTRLVRLFARRFTVQERLGGQIADALAEAIEPHGVAVHLEASTYAHRCPVSGRALKDGHEHLPAADVFDHQAEVLSEEPG
jgi:GTP cyclohydrolase I